ncbi:MAG: hypothetical protein JOZ19_04505 [Rubrobacter sp.]|nr:hypothetical protein [Rubrobacter sp.]
MTKRGVLVLPAVLLAVAMLALSAATTSAQTTGNYVPQDPSTLPQVPGCTWFPDSQYPGMYQDWCGPDSDGNWYRPYDWYLLTGIWPPDYGMGGG